MEITKVGVVGAGWMGGGVAEVCSLAGYTVYLIDITEERLESCLLYTSPSPRD